MSATCSACGRPINVHQQVRGGTCDDVSCRTAAVKRRIKQQRLEREAAERAIAAARSTAVLVLDGDRVVRSDAIE